MKIEIIIFKSKINKFKLRLNNKANKPQKIKVLKFRNRKNIYNHNKTLIKIRRNKGIDKMLRNNKFKLINKIIINKTH